MTYRFRDLLALEPPTLKRAQLPRHIRMKPVQVREIDVMVGLVLAWIRRGRAIAAQKTVGEPLREVGKQDG